MRSLPNLAMAGGSPKFRVCREGELEMAPQDALAPPNRPDSAVRNTVTARGLLTRRAAMQMGVGATVAGALVGTMATALPVQAAAAPITLVWRPWYNFPNGTGPAAISLMQRGLEPWLAKNPGVKVDITTLGYQGATVAAMLAGDGPDVFEDWVLPPYIENNLVYNIQPLVEQDNVNLSIFPSGEMGYFADAGRFAPGGGAGLYCLPAYIHTLAMAVNEGILDQMGLKYPEPDWTYEQWTNLWRTTTVHSADPTKQRYGGQLYWSGYDYYGVNPAPFYMKGFGGGYVNPSNATQCYINQPGSVNCLEWAFGLLQEKVLGSNTFHTGHQVSTPRGTAGGLPYSASAWQAVKWDFFAMPVWPQGRYTFAASDFYAIAAGTKRPDIAWSFLKFLCVETTWQAFMMRLALNGPNQKGLYPEWQRVVGEVAPPLRTKNLGVIVQAVENNEPYFGHTFQYADSQAGAIINQYTTLAQTNKMTVREATAEIARQVNALEATGATTQAQAYKALLKIEQLNQQKGTVQLPPPPVLGANNGNPAHLAPQYAVINKATGTYTLLGDGQDVWNDSDNCVYACAPTTSDQGQWICRVTAISNVNCPNLSPWTKVGMMARGSLGDAAAMVFFAATGGNGIALQERPLAQGGPGGINGSTAKTGLIGAQYLTLNYDKPAPNYLLKPVWLKLVRSGTNWTGYTSFDGQSWVLAGSTPVEMTSAWIGIFVTAHNGDFNNVGYDRGTFDHLSFQPTAIYQLGTTGIPPAAGKVPANWATLTAK